MSDVLTDEQIKGLIDMPTFKQVWELSRRETLNEVFKIFKYSVFLKELLSKLKPEDSDSIKNLLKMLELQF